MILKVARLGFPSVRTVAQAVPAARIAAPEFQQLIDDMVETMYEYHGVGLAAPQVHLPIQLAVLEVENHPRYPDMPSVPLTVLINPVVTVVNSAPIEDWEGCLSIPDLRGSGSARDRGAGAGARAKRRAAGFRRARFSCPGDPARDRSSEGRGLSGPDAGSAQARIPRRMAALPDAAAETGRRIAFVTWAGRAGRAVACRLP